MKVDEEGAMTVLLQGHVQDVRFGVNPTNEKQTLLHSEHEGLSAYTFEDGAFTPQYNHLETKVETKI